uniref:C-type lectin domain-containing protein n=1 Tax=Xiphophorus maculatus TaxID=8083 RepID=A0A3B5R4S1_XIPMA
MKRTLLLVLAFSGQSVSSGVYVLSTNLFQHGPSKYVVVTTFMFWEDAKNYCRSKYTDLVRVWNTSQNNEIHPLIERNHWIGLYRDLWANWSDHSLLTFTNWETGQPDNKGSTNMTSCAAVNTSTRTWWDYDSCPQFLCCLSLPPSLCSVPVKLLCEKGQQCCKTLLK